MPDNPSEPPPKVTPPLPSSGATGRVKAPTTKLPPVQGARTGKVVVMLSSVAKAPPVSTQKLPVVSPPKVIPAPISASQVIRPPQPAAQTPQTPQPPPPSPQPVEPRPPEQPRPAQPPPLPPKQVEPSPTPAPSRLSSTTFVKLPPKTAVPAFTTLTPKMPVIAEKKEAAKVAPPLLPSKRSGPIASEPKKSVPEPPVVSGPPPVVAPPAPPLAGAAVPGKGDMKKSGPIVLNPGPPPQAPPLTSKGDMRKTGMIKLNAPVTEAPTSEESIFVSPPPVAAPAPAPRPNTPKPEGWKSLDPGELPPPAGGLGSLNVFEHSQRLQPKPPPVPPVPSVKTPQPKIAKEQTGATPPPFVPPPVSKEKPGTVPPLTPHGPEPVTSTAKEGPALNPAPVSLAPVHPLHLAPPLVEKGHEETPERLAPPHLPELPKESSLQIPKAPAMVEAPAMPIAPSMPKAPEMVEMKGGSAQPPPLPPPATKPKDKEKLKQSAPIVLKNTSRIFIPGASEVKPALRPAVLPRRATQSLSGASAPASDAPPASEGKAVSDKADAPVPARTQEPSAKVETKPVEEKGTGVIEPPMVAREKADPKPAAGPLPKATAKEPGKKSQALPVNVPLTAGATGAAAAGAMGTGSKKMPALPPTRAQRARKRRLREVAVFWVLVPIAAIGLFAGILYFGRDTRVEGQVIPPDGMTLDNEVWIVGDFRSLASGVADDLANERVPLQQEIQEAQDHVQRVQADIASREERIRLIQEQIQGAKDQIAGIVKKARDDAQALYDGEGKSMDDEYQAKMDALGHAISDRASSLKLPYQPDPNYPSPEVWANAYRLALYQVPPGVDGVKEHQWMTDQMKQWRDFQKTMDDRNEQLREKAAQLKLEPAPKLADLNAKIDDLTQRIAGTQAEEEPLKKELADAQGNLAAAQTADATLDDKYYTQLYALPAENISYHISVNEKGRFTWAPENVFGPTETKHVYWVFSRATRADGRQYWALQQFTLQKNREFEMTLTPGAFDSTKHILRPNLSPDEIEQ